MASVKVKNCPICLSQKPILGLSSVLKRDLQSPYFLSICVDCGVMISDDLFVDSNLDSFYESGAFEKNNNSVPSLQRFNKRTASPSFAHERFEIISQYKDLQPQVRVIEFGCGDGSNLKKFLDFNCSVLGVDLSRDSVEFCQLLGIASIRGDAIDALINLSDAKEKFDVVILSHFLEHVVKPDVFLELLPKILARDAVVYVEVPGFDFWCAPFWRRNKKGLWRSSPDISLFWMPGHIFHFNRFALEKLFCRLNYRPLELDDRCVGVFEWTTNVSGRSTQEQSFSPFSSIVERIDLLNGRVCRLVANFAKLARKVSDII